VAGEDVQKTILAKAGGSRDMPQPGKMKRLINRYMAFIVIH